MPRKSEVFTESLGDEYAAIVEKLAKLTNKPFEEIVAEYGLLSEKERTRALAETAGLEYIDLDEVNITDEAMAVIDKALLLKHTVLPLSFEDGVLTLAIDEQNDFKIRDWLQQNSRRVIGEVRFVYAETAKIRKRLDALYAQDDRRWVTEARTAQGQTIDINTRFDAIMNVALSVQASDIHFSPETDALHLFFRRDGVLYHEFVLPIAIRDQMTSIIKQRSGMDISDKRTAQDGSFSYAHNGLTYDMRVSSMPTDKGENIVIRLLYKNPALFRLEKLGLCRENLQKLRRIAARPYGVVLVTGPTGSGKSTTLYAMLNEIDRLKKNILTIENPIEYRFPFIKQTQYNEKDYTYEDAIKAFMRQDPDVILVGEIRDRATAELAMEASITGHLVLSTLHTNDAVSSIARLRGLQTPTFLLSSGLAAVVSQRLLRKLCPHCKKATRKGRGALEAAGLGSVELEEEAFDCFEAVGCAECDGIGYKGRIAVTEVFEIDGTIRSMIEDAADTGQMYRHARKTGMKPILQDAFEKVLQGVTSVEEVARNIV